MARPGPALFELIRGGGASSIPARSTPSGKPLVRVTPKAQTGTEPPVSAEAPGERAWAAWNGKASLKRLSEPVTLRTSTVLIAVGVAVVVLVLMWGVAYTMGSRKGEERAKRHLGLNVKPESIPLNPGLVASPAKAPEPKPVVDRPTAPPAFTAGGSGTTAGTGASDPRIAGLNYLLLASGLDKDGAERMVQFLNQGGLPSFAVVDKASPGSNNRGSYIVYASKGITPDDYKNRTAARTEVDAMAARLGKAWQKDKKGQTDFSQAYWQKFKG